MVALPTVASDPAVFFGLIAVRKAAATQWSDPVVPVGGSADCDQRPLMTTVWSLTFSRDSRIYGSFAGSGPATAGSQCPGAMPWGKKMPTNRFFGCPAAVWANAAFAGSIASSSGSASVTPAPRRNTLRRICFRVTNDMGSPLL